MSELNEIAELAAKYVNTTNRHIFLTGKAGTGKTTFLKYIIDHTYKNAVVAAPTGIAAINAGGVTLHSLLQLPFGTFVPENIQLGASSTKVNTPRTLFQDAKFNASKRKLIQELELLIIDEVSMLRADLLDCIDHTLRYLRKRRHEPFGGLQLLFIGDLMQLPPVVREDELPLLRPYYNSPYFFEARALADNPPILVELQKIFRQSDQKFIDLLNRLRNNEQNEDDYEVLSEHYQPDLNEIETEGYIHLTTHNRKADAINETRLAQLDGETFSYFAEIKGDFPENLFPIPGNLELKEGAQVMFIKNDPSGEGKFYNGKIGHISRLEEGKIWVKFEDDHEISVQSYLWENKRYVLNKTTAEIEEKFLGSFEQFPLKLAWAVTVHKSQGLTFEKAILDLSGTFAPGQLYVALSRLTSLNGLILSSLLPGRPPMIDPSLISFSESFQGTRELEENLTKDMRTYFGSFARATFNFDSIIQDVKSHLQSFNKSENRSLKQQYLEWTRGVLADTEPLHKTGKVFISQVEQILTQEDYLPVLCERLTKAQQYFEGKLNELVDRFKNHQKKIKTESKVKGYLKELEELIEAYQHQNRQILKISLVAQKASENEMLNKNDLRNSPLYRSLLAEQPTKKSKDKTPTATISFELYKQGKKVEEIAEERGLVVGTIQGHLCQFIAKGELEVNDLLPSNKLNKVVDLYHSGRSSSAELKEDLGDGFSYNEIKLALAHIKYMESIDQ
jgi:hypothetical protein